MPLQLRAISKKRQRKMVRMMSIKFSLARSVETIQMESKRTAHKRKRRKHQSTRGTHQSTRRTHQSKWRNRNSQRRTKKSQRRSKQSPRRANQSKLTELQITRPVATVVLAALIKT